MDTKAINFKVIYYNNTSLEITFKSATSEVFVHLRKAKVSYKF